MLLQIQMQVAQSFQTIEQFRLFDSAAILHLQELILSKCSDPDFMLVLTDS